MHDPRAYGQAFADVYDDWYGELTDADATAEVLATLASATDGPVLELGVGTGRLARPLAARDPHRGVLGLDASREMLARLRAQAPEVVAVAADMVALPVGDRSLSLVFVAFNTLFNLPSLDAIARSIEEAARVLRPGGHLVVEAFVPPDRDDGPDEGVTERPLDGGSLLTWGRRDAAAQVIDGLHVEQRADGVRVRPWRVCYASPDQLDDCAHRAGLMLVARNADWAGAAFGPGAEAHVSCYRRPIEDR